MANIVRRSEGSMTPGSSVIDPFDVMREMLSFEPLRHILGGGMQPLPMQTFMPHFEVRETADAYVFKADLPGVREQDLDITLAQNRLSISGRRELEQRDEKDRYYAVERAYGSFTRTFTLPSDIDDSNVEADLRDGVLSMRIPKSREQQAKKVQLKSSSGTGPTTSGGGAKTAKATPA
jgi:HSP20 family protein